MSRRSKPKRIVVGEYNCDGYAVLLCSGKSTDIVYTAGNHPQDSQESIPRGVGLRAIRGFCIRTCREIAGERNASFGGVSRVLENTDCG
jgi:hypothetical protein